MTEATPVPLYKDRAFISLWSLGLLNSTGRWVEALVVAIFVFDQTNSPFLVASMLVLRLLPMALFGIFGGVLAHRLNRYTVMRYSAALMATVGFITYLLADNDALEVWHVGSYPLFRV